MTVRTATGQVIEAQAAVMALLPGGVHYETTQVSKQLTPDVFGADGYVLPHIFIRADPEVGDFVAHDAYYQAPVTIWVYQREPDEYDIIDQVLNLLQPVFNRPSTIPSAYVTERIMRSVVEERSGELDDDALRCPVKYMRVMYDVSRR